jgi:sugar/nucleoside kinase (ribokinase family)
VGIGALNFDFVIPSSLSQPNGEVIKEGSLSGNEKKHSATKKDVDDEVADWLEHTNRTSLPIVRGGSAFNTTLTLTGMKMGLRTGFLGVSGTPPSGSDLLSHREVLRNAGSEWPFLPEAEAIVGKNSPEEARGGQCVSAMMGNLVERHMLTWPGANALLGRYILDALDAKRLFTIADHLSVARCVHVTTLLDEISADVVATLLEIVRSRSPLTLISFDPGYHWSRMPLDSVLRILRIADILFVSLDELDELVRTYCKTSTSRGEAKKAKLLQTQVARRALVVVVKYPVEATIYRSGDLIERVSRDSLAGNIEDDTAAGDLFSAGFLAAFLAPQLASRAGALVGMELAAKKLVTVDRAEPSDLLRAASKLRLNE